MPQSGRPKPYHTHHRLAALGDTGIDLMAFGQRPVELACKSSCARIADAKLHGDHGRNLPADQCRRDAAERLGGELPALAGIQHDQAYAAVQQDAQLPCACECKVALGAIPFK